MAFEPKETKEKVKSSYKTLYISDKTIEKINKMAAKHNTSFNNIVVSMIEYCLEEEQKTR